MHRIFGLAKGMIARSIELDRAVEKHVETLSRSLWPWRESRLIALVSLLLVLDYASTFAFLKFDGNKYVHEGGPLAG